MIVATQPQAPTIVPPKPACPLPARPLGERKPNPEWSELLSRAWWACSSAHDTYVELLAIADEHSPSAPQELLDLVRLAREQWAACEAWAGPILLQWQRDRTRGDVR